MLKTMAFFTGGVGWMELVVLGVVGLLIFGKRLPEVGRSLGRGIVEFKKGLAGIDDDVDRAVRSPDPAPRALDGQRSAEVPQADQKKADAERPRADGA